MVKVLTAIYLVLLLVLAGCLMPSQVKVSLVDRPDLNGPTASLTTVSVINDQLVLSGAGLDGVTSIRLTGPSLDQTLSIESKNSGSLIANGTANLSLLVGGLFNLIISDASGAATYQVTFTLQNGAVTGSKISQMGAVPGDVLGWNGTTWAPQPSVDSGLLFMGAWDAVSALPAGSAGEYYIAETSNYYDFGAGAEYVRAGDWALFAGASWTHVDKSSGVLKVFGRTGEVTAVEGDISSLDLIGNVNTAGAANGKILKYNGSAWVVGDDLTSAAGSVGSAEITDGSVADADLAGSISQAKVTNLVSDLAGKEATITAGTTAQFYRGDKSWQDFAATVLGTPITGYALGANTPISGTDTILAAFGKIQGQITSGYLSGVSSNIQTQLDTKLSVETDPSVYLFAKSQLPTCLPGEVLSESLGSFVCVTDTVGAASEWVTSGSDIYRSSGNVGIGVSTPGYPLDIGGATIRIQNGNINKSGLITVDQSAATTSIIQDNNGNNSEIQLVAFEAIKFLFTSTERMRLTRSGNLGIGTNNPTATLDIAGNIRIVDGTQGANKVLTSDTNGYASWQTPASAPVTSVNAETGAVVLTANEIGSSATGTVAATNVQSAIAELESEKLGTTLTSSYLFIGNGSNVATATNMTGDATISNVGVLSINSGAIVDADISALAAISATKIGIASSVDDTEFGYLNGVTSSIQTQLNSKLAVETDPLVYLFAKTALPTCAIGEVLKSDGTNFTCVVDNSGVGAFESTANRAVITDASGYLDVSAVTSTELGYLAGVTSNVQTQINTVDNEWIVSGSNIYRSGYLGVGTNNPLSLLHLSTVSAGNPGIMIQSAMSSVGDGGTLRFINNATATQAVIGASYESGNNTSIVFQTRNTIDVLQERVRINSLGYLGIGNSNPAVHLDVNGQVKISGGSPGAGKILTSDATGIASWQTPAAAPVTSVFGRTGAVVATAGDYAASSITNTAAGYLSSTNVQAAIDELDSEKQATDAGLSALSLFNTNGILVQSADNTFVGRSLASVANRTSITNPDGVSGNPTIDIDTTLLPSPLSSGKFLKSTGANASAWSDLLSADVTAALGFTPVNKAGDSIVSGTFDFSGISVVRVLDPILPTDVVNKQYVDQYGQWQKNGTETYLLVGNVGIGTASPSYKLHIADTTAVDTILAAYGPTAQTQALNLGTSSTDRWSINHGSGNALSFYADHTGDSGAAAGPRMIILDSGRVGIGTTNPESQLHVSSGTVGVASVKTYSGYGIINGTFIDGYNLDIGSGFERFGDIGVFGHEGSIGSNLRFLTQTSTNTYLSERMRITKDGTVGIGTTTPASQLHVDGGKVTVGNVISSTPVAVTVSSTTGSSEFIVGQSDTNRLSLAWVYNATPANAYGVINTIGGNPLALQPTGGNVGIGTTAPSSLLQLDSDTTTTQEIRSHKTTISEAAIKLSRTRGTTAAPTTIANGDLLGSIYYTGYDGATYKNAAIITSNADGAVSSGVVPGRLVFGTANSAGTLGEHMRITSTGYVGIGTTSPSQKLHVSGGNIEIFSNTVMTSPGASAGIRIADSNSANSDYLNIGWIAEDTYGLQSADQATYKNLVLNPYGGSVGIGTVNPGYKLDVQGGDINASGSVRAAGVALTSDQRFKRDIATVEDPVEKLLDLRGVTYYWRDQDFPERHFDQKLHYGFIAQEIEQVVPEVVNTDSKGFKSVEYANITSILVEGFKVVWQKILTLFEENREQDREIASIKEENRQLKEYICHKDKTAPFCK